MSSEVLDRGIPQRQFARELHQAEPSFQCPFLNCSFILQLYCDQGNLGDLACLNRLSFSHSHADMLSSMLRLSVLKNRCPWILK